SKPRPPTASILRSPKAGSWAPWTLFKWPGATTSAWRSAAWRSPSWAWPPACIWPAARAPSNGPIWIPFFCSKPPIGAAASLLKGRGSPWKESDRGSGCDSFARAAFGRAPRHRLEPAGFRKKAGAGKNFSLPAERLLVLFHPHAAFHVRLAAVRKPDLRFSNHLHPVRLPRAAAAQHQPARHFAHRADGAERDGGGRRRHRRGRRGFLRIFCPLASAQTWKGGGALSASWFGGSANMLAVKEGLHTPDSVFAPMVIVDTVNTYSWMG